MREVAKHRGPVRRLYDWVLHWAETPYGAPALFVLALAESSFFPIPPDPLLIALCLGAASKSLRFALIATSASVLGGIIGYEIGAGAWHLAEPWFFQYVPGVSAEAFDKVQAQYDRWDFWAIFFAGLTPIPYKVFAISAGVFSINFGIFVVASVLSRSLRFFVLAGLIFKFGQPIASFIDRYFNLLAWTFGILLFGGFLVVELLL
ncbi:MAG TPA: DedA family protein [Gemmatimonadetes bacterium]|nr:DedA family protein [Gemmatimonadota bacterium]